MCFLDLPLPPSSTIYTSSETQFKLKSLELKIKFVLLSPTSTAYLIFIYTNSALLYITLHYTRHISIVSDSAV